MVNFWQTKEIQPRWDILSRHFIATYLRATPKGSEQVKDLLISVGFQTFFIFTPTWGDDPNTLIFLRWVEATN